MSLDKLIGLSLEIIQPDPVTSGRLRTAAQRSVQDSQLTGVSPENSFDLAYKAIMQLTLTYSIAKSRRSKVYTWGGDVRIGKGVPNVRLGNRIKPTYLAI